MLLTSLVQASDAVASVSGRLDKIDKLAALIDRLAPDEVPTAVAFLSGTPRQGRIGVGWSSIADARAVPPASEPTLTLADVDAAFERVASTRGRHTAREKREVLRELLHCATREEQDFLVRLLFGELRQGALEGVLVEAIARAARVPSDAVRRAAMMAGGLGVVARVALTEGVGALSTFSVQLFRPVQPMLADSADEIDEALGRIGDAAVELKLDGARVQVHKEGETVKAYSRNLRDVTPAVPELVESVRTLPARQAILDGEVIALRPDATPLPFQMTMRRFGRRLDVDAMRRELPLTPIFFDCLFLDGQGLVDEPQSRRFQALKEATPAAMIVPHVIQPTQAQAEAFLEDAVRRGHEGIMAKATDAAYAAGRRGRAWVKVKRARTLDLVILAAEWGHGRRKGWLSNLHLGARDPNHGAFVMLGKTFKGLTDEMLVWQTTRLLELEIARDDYTVHVRPELVVEIAFNDVQESPVYPGGLALRFARVKRYRTDKTAAEADTIETVRRIFAASTSGHPEA